MIIFLHFILLLSKYLVTTLSKSLSRKSDSPDDGSSCSEIDENSEVIYQESIGRECKYFDGKLKFCPPVYMQRYEAVYSILQQSPWKESIKKVVDFGCSELGFFLYLKQLPVVEEILEVDIDENALERGISRAAPLNSDYLFCKRSKPMNVYILSGSIAEYDDYLLGTDAVVAIEVIEHLYPDVLDKFPENVFHEIRPKLAIFTTPNADFNALFPNFSGFRHEDHKFEWNRREFYKWTETITDKYQNYSVKFYGIGNGPEGSENLGCCTQMAVFIRDDSIQDDTSSILEPRGINNYKLIRKYEYPFFVDERTDEEKILNEVMYRVKFTINDTIYYNYEDYSTEIPLSEFMDYIGQWCDSEEKLKTILLEHGFHVKESDGRSVLVHLEYSERSYREDDDSSIEYHMSETLPKMELETEDWDLDCVDGNFNDPCDKVPEEDLPSFFTARSVHETGNSKDGLELCRVDRRGTFSEGKIDCNALPDRFRSDISKYGTLNRMQRKKIRKTLLRNPSRNLVRFSSLSMELGGSIESLYSDGDVLAVTSSDSGIYVFDRRRFSM